MRSVALSPRSRERALDAMAATSAGDELDILVVGAQVNDLESGRTFDVRARQVVNATGVWTDDTQSLAGERGQFHVRATSIVCRASSTCAS